MLAVRGSLPSRWLTREMSGDYGIDLEIEFATATVSGRFCKAQVKGHTEVSWTQADTFLQPVPSSTLNYWAAMPVPVLLLLAETQSGTVWWARTDRSREPSGVRIRREDSLPSTAAGLERDVIDWLDARSGNAAICAVPVFVDQWDTLNERLDRDCFLALPHRDYVRVQTFYEQLLHLRRLLGLAWDNVIPWEAWVARSRVTFSEREVFHWGTHDEVVEYARPLVAETVAAARRILVAQDANVANAAAKSWAESDPADNCFTTYRVDTSFENQSEEFWSAFDEGLRRRGALRGSAAHGWRSRRDRSRTTRTD
ncbi:MAG: DUF4365 domain-containing protein [Deltaproteobacteria bacterium]|nr:DUF4365 domain-containing protein [Deltaproteobacteria bacterium]